MRLSDVATIGAGDPAPQGKQYYEEGAHLFVRTQDVGRVKHSRKFHGTKDKVNNKAVKEKGLRLWPKGTTLIPKSGASTLLNNRVRLSEPAYVSSHLATVVPKDNISSLFLYYNLCLLDVRRLLRNPGYPSLSIEDLGSVRISLPSLPEQEMISSSLDSIDDIIDIIESVINKTEQLRDSLLHGLLTQGLPGHHKEWKEVPGLGIIPASWQVVHLSDISEIITGNTPPRVNKEYYGGQIPWVKPSDLRSHYVSESDEYLTTKGVTVARLVPEGSVLVSCIGTVGEVAIAKIPLCFNQQINALIPIDTVLSSFLYWSILYKTEYIQSITPKTAVPILNKKQFSQIRISLPSPSEQKIIAQILNSIDMVLEHNIYIIHTFKVLSKSLRGYLLNQVLYNNLEEKNK